MVGSATAGLLVTSRWNGRAVSGPNGTTLHYDVNRREMRAGELVAVDAGAEWGQYTADVTRTFPVGTRFESRQRALYELVLASQEAAIASMRLIRSEIR